MAGLNLGFGKSDSESQSSFQDDVWGPQGDALGGMYGQMGGLWDQTMGQQGNINQQAGSLTPQMQNIMDQAGGGYQQQLGGGSFGDTSDIRQRLMGSMGQPSQMGQMYQSIVGGQGNTYIDPMVQAMKAGGLENLQSMQAGTGLDAAAAGQSGSSRHAMQNAMQSRSINEDMIRNEMNMRGGAYDTDLNMRMDIAKMADTNRQSEQDRMMQMMQGSDANQQGGMQFGQNMQNLGMGTMAPWMQAMQNPWTMMNQYSQNMGDPTVLRSGDSSSEDSSWNFGFGASK